jgi:CheY-like chemotaxis protein
MIIVVDDEPDILQFIREILWRVNYEVITATSGDEAWIFDMVLTDVVMPGSIDGLELAAKIHQVDPSLPVLFLTGALPESDTSEFLALRSVDAALVSPNFKRDSREKANCNHDVGS